VDPDGDAVTGFQIIDHDDNLVPVKKVHEPPGNKLGLHNTVHGANVAFNLKIDFAAGDKLENYKVERDALIIVTGDLRTGKKENPDDPGQVHRTGQSMLVFDSPALELQGLTASQGSKSQIGTGYYVTFYEVRVVDKTTGKADPQTFHYMVSIQYENGQGKSAKIEQVDKAVYDEAVKRFKKR